MTIEKRYAYSDVLLRKKRGSSPSLERRSPSTVAAYISRKETRGKAISTALPSAIIFTDLPQAVL